MFWGKEIKRNSDKSKKKNIIKEEGKLYLKWMSGWRTLSLAEVEVPRFQA